MNGSQSTQMEKEGCLLWGRLEHGETSFSPPEVSEFASLNMLCLPPLDYFPVLKKHYNTTACLTAKGTQSLSTFEWFIKSQAKMHIHLNWKYFHCNILHLN